MLRDEPPYFGLRDYGHPGQIGLEKTPAEYVAALVEVFEGVRELLADDGVLWLNLGDSYGHGTSASRKASTTSTKISAAQHEAQGGRHGGPAKQLLGIPWRVAFALQEAGWYLRQDVIAVGQLAPAIRGRQGARLGCCITCEVRRL